MFIPVGDALIYATAFGARTAPPIIGVGGWIGSWELWAEPFAILSERWRTIAYDHRGAGITRASAESITAEQLVDDLFAVMDASGVERCVVAAESAGAITALGAALRHPERISGLALVGGLPYQPPGDTPFAAGLRQSYDTTLDGFVDACVPEPDSEHIRHWGRQILRRADKAGALALLAAAATVDLRPELGRITQPALVVHGTRDAIVPIDAARWLARALPNAELVELEGAGHVPSVTRPADVARAIERRFGGEG